jgi:AcrR family transcriptional regulator
MAQHGRRAEIHEVAARLFRAKGYHATRIQDVAEALGMQKGSLYHYISSKEDLLRGIVETPIERMIADAREVLATGYPPEDKLTRVIEGHLRHFQEHRDLFGIFLREDLDLLDQASDSDLRALVGTYDALVDDLLREGMETGAFRTDLEPPVVRKAIIGMCNGTYTWFDPDGAHPIQEIARQFAAFALRGVQESEGNSA